MCVLDGKAYQTLQEAGREGILDEVLNCVLLANNQVRQQLEALKHLCCDRVCKQWIHADA